MAEFAVGFVVQKLVDLLVQEAINLHGVRKQVEWLKTELQWMQCFLMDADAKERDDEKVRHWVREIRDLAFEAQGMIDVYMDLKIRRQQKRDRVGFMKRCILARDELIHRHKFHVNVQRIKAKMSDITERRIMYGIADIGETTSTSSRSRRQDMIPIEMVGFDDEKKKIVQELVDMSNKNRSVISIVGMGGVGKTTLAASVYKEPEVKESFDILLWAYISQQYTILEIVKTILSCVPGTSSIEQLPVDDLSVILVEKLKKLKYLIVLDDIWNKNVWYELQKVLVDVNNGSRVIITTHLLNVVEVANPATKLHQLKLLSEKESWELFIRRAVATSCPKELVDSAHKLVRMCNGLPLALTTLGGLMSTIQQSKVAWEKVVENFMLVLHDSTVFKILSRSYYNLPYFLKLCFLYFGCFGEGVNIPAKTLIRLWSAEDVLPTEFESAHEEIGMDYLEALAQSSMIQVTKQKYDVSAKYCQIHDLLLHMCILEAKERRFLEIYNNEIANCGIKSNAARHLIIFNHIETLNYSNPNLQGLFYGQHNPLNFKALKGQLNRFKLLRVLYLNILDVSEFPSEIKSLIHLRYLELHADNLEEVPSWIGHLRNLQTFIIRSKVLEMISDSLWRIESLAHVDVPTSSSVTLPNMGNNVVLKKLQTLKGVTAGEWIGNMLPKLTNLRKLNICEISDDHANALSSSLENLVHLASLTIEGDEIPLDNIIRAFSKQDKLKKLYLEGKLNCKQLLPHDNVFPQQLLKLSLLYSELEHDPMETLEKLPFLKYLELGDDSYRGKQMKCSATGFIQLLSLSIRCCDKLEEWKIEQGAMPCLKSLQLCYCPELMVIPEGLKNVPLDQLVLKHMPNHWYKIHVPNISIES